MDNLYKIHCEKIRNLCEDIWELKEQFHPDSMEADFSRTALTLLVMLDDYIEDRR